MLAILVFVSSLFAADDDINVFNCSLIVNATNVTQAEADCMAAGWCYWAEGVCRYDGCLKYVADADYNGKDDNCETTNAVNGVGTSCKLYYLNPTYDCTTANCPETGATDLYCRESSATRPHLVIEDCFFQDLKLRSTNSTQYNASSPYVYSTSCKSKVISGQGSYVYPDPVEVQDCSTLPQDSNTFCDCLGVTWCNLHPYCTKNKKGDACIIDPCITYVPGSTSGNPCTPNVAGCTTSSEQNYLNGNTLGQRKLCVATGSNAVASVNNDTNECYFAYAGSSSPSVNCPTIRKCNNVASVDQCETAHVYKSDGTQDSTLCKKETLPVGYFPTDTYCSDGRSVPSLSAAASIGTSFLTVLLALAVLFVL